MQRICHPNIYIMGIYTYQGGGRNFLTLQDFGVAIPKILLQSPGESVYNLFSASDAILYPTGGKCTYLGLCSHSAIIGDPFWPGWGSSRVSSYTSSLIFNVFLCILFYVLGLFLIFDFFCRIFSFLSL